ncbi:hypothetical protein ACJMK2_029580 [Sinanodonta woodiana]|uniref:Sodium-dependent glucose transporter 1-like protein n=1 Tax=Sinanodonta woodiana TaxID=1069815 RepID=A0ABD3XE81_SINWO
MASQRYLIIKTLFLISIAICKGMYSEIPGATMIDLKILFNAKYEQISRSVSARGIGSIIGGFIGGFFMDRFRDWSDLLLAVFLTLGGFVLLFLPFVHDLGFLWFVFFATGISSGVANIAINVGVLLMWEEKAAPPLHAIHMGFGVGAILAPLVANPFLAVPADDQMNGSSAGNTSFGNTTKHYLKESAVQYPFVIIAFLIIGSGIPFFVYQCLHIKERKAYSPINSEERRKPSLKEMINPATYADGSLFYGCVMFCLLFVYYFMTVGGEQMFGNFVRSFAVDNLHFSRNHASYLDTAFWACFTVGRFIGIVSSKFFSLRFLLITEVALNFISVTAMDISATKGPSYLWGFTIAQGLIAAPLYPIGMSFGNTLVKISGVCLTLIEVAGSLGDFTFIWLAGKYYDSYGPQAILYGYQASSILVLIVGICFLIVSCLRKDRFSRTEFSPCELPVSSEVNEIETSDSNKRK